MSFNCGRCIRCYYIGYNQDFHLTKEPYLKAISLIKDSLEVCNFVVENLGVNRESLRGACSDELYATQEAYDLVKQGMNFRDAYKKIGNRYV